MTEQILMGVAGLTAEAFAAIGAGVVVVVSTFIFRRRQRAVVARLVDRVTHLAAGVSLLANLLGASLILVSLLVADFNLSATVMEGAWALVALAGLIRLALRRTRSS